MEQLKIAILGWFIGSGVAAHILIIKDLIELIIKKRTKRKKCGKWEIKSRVYQYYDEIDEELYIECPFCNRTEDIPFEFEEKKIIEYIREEYPYCHCGAKNE